LTAVLFDLFMHNVSQLSTTLWNITFKIGLLCTDALEQVHSKFVNSYMFVLKTEIYTFGEPL